MPRYRRQSDPTTNLIHQPFEQCKYNRNKLDIPKIDNWSNISIEKWIALFKMKAAEQNFDNHWKVHHISKYLAGEIFEWYLDAILEQLKEWEEIQNTLISCFKNTVSDKF